MAKRGEKIVIACSGGKHVARKIARKINAKYSEVKTEEFPDSEIKVNLPEVKNKKVYFVQSFYKEKTDINDKIIEVLFCAYTARELKAKKVFLIAPYLAYMREDKRFNKGEAISAKIISKLFNVFNKVYAVEPHLHRFNSFKEFFSNAKKIKLDVETAEYINKNIKEPYVLVGPDSESEQWVKAVAKKLNKKYVILNKERFSSKKVKVKGEEIENKNVVIIDDIISTGNTLIEASKLIKANNIYFIGMHGLFSGNAIKNLNKKGKVVTSNSIPNKAGKIDCSKAIAKKIK